MQHRILEPSNAADIAMKPESILNFADTLKSDWDDSMQDTALEEDTVEESHALNWTLTPRKKVEIDGNLRYEVSTPATAGDRVHMPHLVRSVKLEPLLPVGPKPSYRPSPRVSSGRCSGHSSKPPACKEQIVVHEADFRRYRHSLTLLRQCQMQPQHPQRSAAQTLQTSESASFKSAFDKKCRAERLSFDDWENAGDAEGVRDPNETDLILNQVWADRLPENRSRPNLEVKDAGQEKGSRRRRSASASTRASSSDSPRITSNEPQEREGSLVAQRTRSSGHSSRGRRRRQSSGCPHPPSGHASVTSTLAGDKGIKYESRIELIDNEGMQEADSPIHGSSSVRRAASMQRRFERQIGPHLRFIWLSLDPLTGDVSFFPKPAAQRLESAFKTNKAHVALTVLGDDLDSVVDLDCSKKEAMDGGLVRATQRSDGESREVRRMGVQSNATQVCLNVIWNKMWRFADNNVPGEIEERRVDLPESLSIRSETPPLPPADPNRRLFFCNARSE